MSKFLSRKWLLSMYEGEVRVLPASKCLYVNIKNTCHQLKQLGIGEWLCSKKGMREGLTRITRVK